MEIVTASVVTAALAQLWPAATGWRQARNRLAPRLSGVGRASHVALTFDDGPDPTSTPAFLDTLDSLGWRATFFMLGTMAARWPDLVTEVAQRGHEVAVHGYTHSNHLRHGPHWVERELLTTRDKLAELTGVAPVWVRPPYGALSTSTFVGARRAGLRTVLWTSWGRDWRDAATAESIVDDVQRTLVRGATVLLHDSDCTSTAGSWKATLASLPLLAEHWEASGLTVGPLADHGLLLPRRLYHRQAGS